jgi:cytokinin dehydrogenase
MTMAQTNGAMDRRQSQRRSYLHRRAFLKEIAAASGAVIVGVDPLACRRIPAAHADEPKLKDLPSLDGRLQADDSSRDDFSFDVGHNLQRVPLAVLKPGSVEDVVRIVNYANRYRLRIAMRGRGHSQYGQTLVDGGIVIDSTTLNAVTLAGPDSADVRPGATWGEVNQATLPAGRTPPVMPDTMTTVTVGGILSVGGWGETSHHFGAIVDTVQELNVVTGDGRLITCSPQRESELFEMVLAGLGQCGFIVRARLRLLPAPSHVVRQELIYDTLDAYLSDASRLVLDGRFDYQVGFVVPNPSGGWSFRMRVGKSYAPPQEPNLTSLTSGLKFNSATEPTQGSYRDYLWRNATRDAGFTATAMPRHERRGFITMFVPALATKTFTGSILATPAETAGLMAFGFAPLNVRRFTRPLFKLPTEDVALSLWIFRRANADTAAYSELIASNRAVLERMRAIGGKRYTPYSTYLAPADWKEHFGAEVWRRLVAAKKKFDPNRVLTPGPNIFG